MKIILSLFLLISTTSFGQRLRKDDKEVIQHLKTTIAYLASDQLQGRRTGTEGEKLAYTYLVKEFKNIGLLPKGGNGSYLQAFEIIEGREIKPATFLIMNEKTLKLHEDYFPLTFSANANVKGMVSPSIRESNAPWFWDIQELIEKQKSNPHFDFQGALISNIKGMKEKGATAVLLYTSGTDTADVHFHQKSKDPALDIPVVYLTPAAVKKYLQDKTSFFDLALRVELGPKKRTGHNVIGYWDNGAPSTIVIGAHYDHLGYGQDHNSLYTGKPAIHNGADDNASGTALVLEMAKKLKESKYDNNNYLFILFSGEELGLFGSKYFTSHPTVPLESINYMVNCDMVGRLDKDTRTITIGGYGTSPLWGEVLPDHTKSFSVKFDSSGIGPSDHTSFYLKDIPVLFFFTGTHSDYHKPSDDANKINYEGELRIFNYLYELIEETDNEGKLAFTKTKEPAMSSGPKFTVTLGIMPDYTYSRQGLRIDGVIDGRVADHAGMQTGDVIIRIGEYAVNDIRDYMKALSKYKKGDAAQVVVKRVDEEKEFDVVF